MLARIHVMTCCLALAATVCRADFDWGEPASVVAEGAPAARVTFEPGDGGLRVRVVSAEPLTFVRLGWRRTFAADARFFGGDWERTYGTTGWMRRNALRPMPWYFLVEENGVTFGCGVKVQPGAFAAWVVTNDGVELVLDCRAGSDPVDLHGRTLEACTLVTRRGAAGETPFQAAQAFCRRMCDRPRLPKSPVYGYNDWYCAYGQNTATNFLADAKAVLSGAKGLANRPFAVCDDGWQAADDWRGVNARWGLEMDRVAARLKAADIRPGLWYRPLRHFADDPTRPAVAETVRGDFAAFRRWGYELVKVDFITYDWSRTWNAAGVSPVTRDDLHWQDRTRTTAETVRDLYRTFRAAAGEDVMLIGCNALDHLAAGLFEVQRTGDDTSGCDWSLTALCGPNALGMRAHHHGTFYAQDGDCAGLSYAGAIDGARNRQWIDLLSRSGGAFFVSWGRELLDAATQEALAAAFARAAAPQPAAEPLDWQARADPQRWDCGGETRTYDWAGAPRAEGPVTRFLVIGDLHYGNADDNGDPAEARAQRLADDVKRKKIAFDFVIQVGDLVNCQTGATPRCLAECHAEWAHAIREVKRLFPDKPFLTTPGNHDWYGGDSWQGGLPCIKAHYIPFMERELGQPMNGLPLTAFRFNDCAFIFLNHLGMHRGFDIETRRLADRALTAAERDPSVARVFAVSHPQLWNVDYFRFHENATLLPRFLRAKKFDAYFSGHVHENSVTARRNDFGFALRQICAAGTWPPVDEGPKRFRAVPTLTLNPAPSVRLFEDHPADVQSYTVVSASRAKVDVRFEAVGGGILGAYAWTGPYETKAVMPAAPRGRTDRPSRIVRASLCYFPYVVDRILGPFEKPRVRVNGRDVGEIACNQSFFHTNWGRFALDLPPECVQDANTVEVVNPSGLRFLLRDLAIRAVDADGVAHFTPVYGKVLAFGDPAGFYMGFGLAHDWDGILHSDVSLNVPDELVEKVVPPTAGRMIRLRFDEPKAERGDE